MLSIFDIFKIGIGPSSSHTMGPMKAAHDFIEELVDAQQLHTTARIEVDVYGSLALTGKGHHTDSAILLGLAGNLPQTVDVDGVSAFLSALEQNQQLPLANKQHTVAFTPANMRFHRDALPLHENGMRLHAYDAQGTCILTRTYYSTGGGFVVEESQFGAVEQEQLVVAYPFDSAAALLAQCKQHGLSISSLVLANERSMAPKEDIDAQCEAVWQTMHEAIERGCHTEGLLAGPMRVPRRAASLKRQLEAIGSLSSDPMNVVDWVNMFALAVSEENAAGGRVVTAPTNGAAGIIPAVMAYYDRFIKPIDTQSLQRFLAASGAVGMLYKMNASVSGAEVGCQGEVGVACSMAAAGLAEVLGASPMQVCIAAEIGMEHNLGLTCDPVAGQVQVPCIERNAIASVKAINACRMAMRRSSEPLVCLDRVIETMYATGKDMHVNYRETSQGGLAIKINVAATCS